MEGAGAASWPARGGDTWAAPPGTRTAPRRLCNRQRDLATTGHSFRRLCFVFLYSSSHFYFFSFFIWPSSSVSFLNTEPTHAAKHCYNPRTSYVSPARLGSQEPRTMHFKHNFIGQTGYASTWKNYNLFYKHFLSLVPFFFFIRQAQRATSAKTHSKLPCAC